MPYRKCCKCKYCFRIQNYQLKTIKDRKKKILCPACGSDDIDKILKVEWANQKGLMNPDLWEEKFMRGGLTK